jgi:hypothetical protein
MIKIIKYIVEEIKMHWGGNQYIETYKGRMFRLYCSKIAYNKPHDSIEAYESILEKIMTRCGYDTKEEAAVAYLFTSSFMDNDQIQQQ